MSPLLCPRCASPYPRWRLGVPSRRRICNVCTSRLTLTVASAQRIGALAGLAFVGILTPLTFIADGGTVRWIPFAYVLATITTMFAAKLALYDDVRRDPRRWQIVPNVPARPRRHSPDPSLVPALVARDRSRAGDLRRGCLRLHRDVASPLRPARDLEKIELT